jgi:3-methyladenine DNA glycosylase AlkD
MLAIQRALRKKKNPRQARVLQGFFKTGKGEYGEGDIFLGLKVPETRSIAKQYTNLNFPEIKILLYSKIHEERLAGVLLLVHKFENGSEAEKAKVFRFYIQHSKRMNNWDLVDLSASRIVGGFLQKRDRSILYRLAKSKNLWERRIAIIATFQFIYKNEYQETFKIADILLCDKEDLMHKATGWMLREVGKRVSEKKLEKYLSSRLQKLPRTTLRYAIERFPEKKRKQYLVRKAG